MEVWNNEGCSSRAEPIHTCLHPAVVTLTPCGVGSIGSPVTWRRNTSSLQPGSGRIPTFTAEYTRAVVAEDDTLTESGARRCSLLPHWSSSPWLSSCCPPTSRRATRSATPRMPSGRKMTSGARRLGGLGRCGLLRGGRFAGCCRARGRCPGRGPLRRRRLRSGLAASPQGQVAPPYRLRDEARLAAVGRGIGARPSEQSITAAA